MKRKQRPEGAKAGGTASMLKKLQHKFMALNLITAASVLVATFGVLCYVVYQLDCQQVQTELDHALTRTIAAVNSTYYNTDPAGALPEPDGGESSDSSDGDSAHITIGPNTTHTIAIGVYKLKANDLEMMSRYTTAQISTKEERRSAAASLRTASDGFGTLDDLSVHYLKRTAADGCTYVAFASMAETSGWKELAWLLIGAGIVIMAIFLVINKFFSRWALKPVRESWIQQKRFVADASHDLKTPLTVILANSAILKEHPERTIASQSQWIESTENEAKQMQELVNDLLLLARLDEGVELHATETVDFSTLLEGELLEFESVAFELGITLDSSVAEGLQVAGSQSRLRRLVTTLLDNACKYTPKGDAVIVRLQRIGGDKLRFSVNNTGSLISEEDLPHIFDRFYRTDKSRTNASNTSTSHGLGLAIAHAIAEEHGGTLTATSDKEHGTTFTAELPLKK